MIGRETGDLSLGVAYHGTGRAEVAAAAVKEAMRRAQMAVTEIVPTNQELILVGQQERSWIEVLARALPQKVTWRIWERV